MKGIGKMDYLREKEYTIKKVEVVMKVNIKKIKKKEKVFIIMTMMKNIQVILKMENLMVKE